ncbi:MAG TPA: hypothetical protein VNQ73_02285 [Ilumatobacter sp.]|nr:hypothetical protein [Ilumatobacter sp.]
MRWFPRVVSVSVFALAAAGCGGDDQQAGDPAATDAQDAPSDARSVGGDASVEVTVPQADLLDELQEQHQQTASALSTGDAVGSVTVAGVTYTVSSELCIAQGTEFLLEGPAEGSDGSLAWVSIERSISSRDELAPYLPDEVLDLMFGDGDTADVARVGVDVGRDSMYSDGDSDAPDWEASNDAVLFGGEQTLEFALVDGGISGEGQAIDMNAVAVAFGETAPLAFDVACR